MSPKVIDLENGFELVVEGDYKEIYQYEQHILETWSAKHGNAKIYIRKKEDKG